MEAVACIATILTYWSICIPGELEIKEHKKITRLHKGDCAFIRKDFSVQLTKQACKMEQFKAVFLMFTDKFLRNFTAAWTRKVYRKMHDEAKSVCTDCRPTVPTS